MENTKMPAKKGMAAWLKVVIAVVVIGAIGTVGYYGATGELFQGRSFSIKAPIAKDTIKRDISIVSVSNDVTSLKNVLSNDIGKVRNDLLIMKRDIKDLAVSNSVAEFKLTQLEDLTNLSGKYPALKSYVSNEFDKFNLNNRDLTQKGIAVNVKPLRTTDFDNFVNKQAKGFLEKGETVLAVYDIDQIGINNVTHFFPNFSYKGDANSDLKVVVFDKDGKHGFAEFNFDDLGILDHTMNDIAERVTMIAIVGTESFSGSNAILNNGFAVEVESAKNQGMFVSF